MDPLSLTLSISGLVVATASAFARLKDIKADSDALIKQVKLVGAVVQDAAIHLEPDKLSQESSVAALQKVDEALGECRRVAERLAAKSTVVKLLRSGDYVAELKAAAAGLAQALSAFQLALGAEQHADLKNSIREVHDGLINIELRVMRGFAEQAAALRELVDQANQQRARSSSPNDTPEQLEQRIVHTVRSAMQQVMENAGWAPGASSAAAGTSAAGTQALDAPAIIAALQQELAELHQEKRALDEAYLAQIVSALTIQEESSVAGQDTADARSPGSMRPPHNFMCPITWELMRDPVMLVESGHSFERAAIERHLATSDRNPLTNQRLRTKEVAPNITLRNAIEEWSASRSGSGSLRLGEAPHRQTSASPGPAPSAAAPVPGSSSRPPPDGQAGGRAGPGGGSCQAGPVASGSASGGTAPSPSGAQATTNAVRAPERQSPPAPPVPVPRPVPPAPRPTLSAVSAEKGKRFVSACERGDVATVKAVLRHGWDPDGVTNEDGGTPLHVAARSGQLEVVRALLAAGANKHAMNKDGATPLHVAGSSGHSEVVRALLAAGANKEASNKDGETPLHLAASAGHLEVVRALLAAGANKEATTKNGSTPLHWVARHDYIEVVRALLAAGANKEAKNKYGWTPLHMAARLGCLEAVRALLAAGANKEARNNDGQTAGDLAKADEYNPLGFFGRMKLGIMLL